MKRHLSVFGLMVRSTFGRIVLLLTAMTAVEAAAFAALTLRGPTEKGFGLEPILQKSGAVWIFGAAALLMTLLLCRTGMERRTKPGYLLMRLSVSERWVFVWQSVYNVFCYFLLWAWQILTGMLLCLLYTKLAPPEFITGQTVFLAWYRSDFFHSLLPMEEGLIWFKNAMLALALGIAAARYPMGQRRGSKVQEVSGAFCAAVIFFVEGIGSEPAIFAVLVAMFTIGVSVFRTLDQEEFYETEEA